MVLNGIPANMCDDIPKILCNQSKTVLLVVPGNGLHMATIGCNENYENNYELHVKQTSEMSWCMYTNGTNVKIVINK